MSAKQAIADAAERAEAINVRKSFVVQAPAGSGKTGLLVQRFLALLALVERPESVLAITFTRKAAGEMRRRIVEALHDARDRTEPPAEDFRRTGYELAKAVLARDAQHDWNLLNSPSRLQVFTIDGFCARVVAGTPLLSRLGSTPGVAQDPNALYREAVRRTLSASGRALLGEPLEVLLERYEMGIDRLEKQLIEMLKRRDQWGAVVVGGQGREEEFFATVERTFGEVLEAEVAAVAEGANAAFFGRIHDVARRSRASGDDASAWPTLGEEHMLGAGLAAASAWRQAAALLTKTKKLRAKTTRDQDVHGSDQDLKEDFKALLADLAEDDGDWADRLMRASQLAGTVKFSVDGERAIGAFLAILRNAYGELWQVFRERREVDYVEIAMCATAALGYGETLEKLDARLDHILVDEFQDTNILQCELLRGLTSGWQENDGRTLFLVGDPMQSIYRFRKAEVGLFLAAWANPRFLGACALTPLRLSVNFRSTKSVVEWVNNAFAELLGDRDDAGRSQVAFAPASPRPDADEGEPVELFLWDCEEEASAEESDRIEAAGLADWMVEHLRERGAGGEEESKDRPPIAVLVRARSHALQLLQALEDPTRAVRVRAPGLAALSARPVVADLEALTRALLHPADRVSWLATLRAPSVGLALGDLAELVEPDVASRGRKAAPIPLLLRDEEALARLSPDGRPRVARLIAVLDAAEFELASRGLDVVVRAAWLRLGGCAPYQRSDATASQDPLKVAAMDAELFFDLLAANVRHGQLDLDELRRALDESDAAVDRDSAVDVEIMTMHKAKGLEFDTVVLPGLTRRSGSSDALPLAMETEPRTGKLVMVAPQGARGRDDEDKDKYDFLQAREKAREGYETLRLLYVAATRARSKLILSAPTGRLNKGGGVPAGSLLGALSPALDVEGTPRQTATLGETATPALLLRLKADFAWKVALPSVVDSAVRTESPSALGDAMPIHFADSRTSAHIGSVFHDFAERIANEGLDAWPSERPAAERAVVAYALRSRGVLADELDEAVERVVDALASTLADERGRWILSSHGGARSEWAMQAYRDRRLTSAIVDRTLDVDGARWIIDFKTGRMPEMTADAARTAHVEEKRELYRPQLASYRDLLAARDASLPIRLALYFPEWPTDHRWQDITEVSV